MDTDGAAGGSVGGDAVAARPMGESLWRDRLEWANRLMLLMLASTPVAAVGSIWLLRDALPRRSLAAWLVLLSVVCGASTWLVVLQRRSLRRSDARERGGWLMLAVVATSMVFLLPTWLLVDDAGTRALPALMYPVVSLGVGVVVFAPMRRWFYLHHAVTGIGLVVWTVREGAPYFPEFTAIVIGYMVLAQILHRQVHALVLRSITIKVRNEALVVALRDDQARIERANEQLEEANRRLRHQAGHDALTGVLNRRGLEERLERFMAHARLADRHVMVLFCDLDRFKVVNDSLGHAAGDRLLTTTAERIGAVLPDTAMLARLGGDEFVAVVSFPHPETEPSHAAVRLADRVRDAVAAPVVFEEREFAVTTTVGVAMAPTTGGVSLDVLRQADRALHYAKDAGRNRVEVFGERHHHALPHRVEDQHTVRTAIEQGHIVPWYQPIVDATTGRIVGAELLARWIDTDGRTVRASEFIGTAEDTGLLDQLTHVLIDRAVIDLADWVDDGLPGGFRLGLNLPPRFVSRATRVEPIMELLARAPRGWITAEISESSVVDDHAVAAGRLRELRDAGMLVVLDDFGTGSASLTLLQRMPLDGVKVDKSFVTAVADNDRDRALVSGFVRLAHELGLTVTAEGIETVAQASALVELGCVVQQGYLFGDAVDAIELRALLLQGRLPQVRNGAVA